MGEESENPTGEDEKKEETSRDEEETFELFEEELEEGVETPTSGLEEPPETEQSETKQEPREETSGEKLEQEETQEKEKENLDLLSLEDEISGEDEKGNTISGKLSFEIKSKKLADEETARLVDTLQNTEKQIINSLKDGSLDLSGLTDKTGLDHDTLMHAAIRLSDKKIVDIKESEEKAVEISDEALNYVERGLPEKILAAELARLGGEADFKLIRQDETFNIALSWALKNQWISINKENGETKLVLTPQGKQAAETKSPEETLLQKISQGTLYENLSEEEKKLVEKLSERKKLVEIKEKIRRKFSLTPLGQKLASLGLTEEEEISILTPTVIKSGKWREAKLRKYDLHAPVPTLVAGKKHPYLKVLDEVRELLIGMGFKEAKGPLVVTEFWNFDALFQSQEHPARADRDIYSAKTEIKGQLPQDELVENVKKTHETGGETDSIGWRYSWSQEKARRLILRSHSTAVSAQLLAQKPPVPSKYFCIGRNFRPDVIDATHLPEFNQCEGIVLDYNLTFRDLLGYLEVFAREIGKAEEVRFVPGYFPYTEPSVELFAKHPDIGWMELGGAGLFRPEVTLPLGIDCEVLAWGLGIDRIAMLRMGIRDIRKLFSDDLGFLREQSLR